MGLAYLCVEPEENGRLVALKTFRPELFPDRAARGRFLYEDTTWVQLELLFAVIKYLKLTLVLEVDSYRDLLLLLMVNRMLRYVLDLFVLSTKGYVFLCFR